MSVENVELVKRIYALWDAGESANELIDRDMEYVNPPYAVEPGVKRGRKSLASVRDVIPDFHFEPEQYRDAGEDVVVIGMARGTTASGVPAEWRQGYVWTFRDGRAVRFCWFTDPAEALRAAGLEG